MDSHALGRYLRETRESKEISLQEAELKLRIRRSILESFESGNFAIADASKVQMRGFLRNYARFLGLEPDIIVGYYETAKDRDASRFRRIGRRKKSGISDTPIAPKKITDTPPVLPAVNLVELRDAGRRRSLLATITQFLIALAALAVIVFVGYQLIQQAQNDSEPTNDDTVVADTFVGLIPTATPTVTPTIPPATATPVLPGSQGSFSGEGILVTLEMKERTWIRVVVDGEQQLAEMIPLGEVLEFSGVNMIEITAASGTAFDLVYNGEIQEIASARGRQLELMFTPDDFSIISGDLPTATPGPSPTPTPFVSNVDLTPTEQILVESVDESTSEAVAPVEADQQESAPIVPTQITPLSRSSVENLPPTLTPFPGIPTRPSLEVVSGDNDGSLTALDLLADTPTPSEQEIVVSNNSGNSNLSATTPIPALSTPTSISVAREVQPTQTIVVPTATQTATITATSSPTATFTATATITPTSTATGLPTATAILPLRVTAVDATPKKGQ